MRGSFDLWARRHELRTHPSDHRLAPCQRPTSDLLFVQPSWMPRRPDLMPCKALCVYPAKGSHCAVPGDSGAVAYEWVPESDGHQEGWQCLGVVWLPATAVVGDGAATTSAGAARWWWWCRRSSG